MKAYRVAVGAVLVAITVVISACGGSTCDRAESASKSLDEKGKACQSSSTTADGGTPAAFNRTSCEADVKSCNADDLTIINKQFDCIDKVEACVKGNELAYLGSILACTGDSQKLSAACAKAVSGK
jgi:hypothetical protein